MNWFVPRCADGVAQPMLGGARGSRARNIPGQSNRSKPRCPEVAVSNELAVSVLEANKPADAIAIHHLAIGSTPWAYLQILTDRSFYGQGVEPSAQLGCGRRAEKGEHEPGALERFLVTCSVGCEKGYRPAKDAMRNGVSRAVITPELFESVKSQLAAEDLVVEGQCVTSGAWEEEIGFRR
jgi:hypothetical protein